MPAGVSPMPVASLPPSPTGASDAPRVRVAPTRAAATNTTSRSARRGTIDANSLAATSGGRSPFYALQLSGGRG